MLAARNVHKAFLSAAALLDLDVVWIPTEADGSYLSAHPTPEVLDAALAETGAAAVYLTCPDYLGFLPDLRPLAGVCHAHGALLLVDNAHGAYLRFLSPSRHPMDLGADFCCDSAHKTLPVLTGGAYLHVKGSGIGDQGSGEQAFPLRGRCPSAHTGADEVAYVPAIANQSVRDALALFGSSSPSYLILQSLDLANPYLEALPEKLAAFLPRVEALKARLRAAGWELVGDEPLKLTIRCPSGRSEESVNTVNTGDGSLRSPACGSMGAALRQHREPSPVSLSLAAALERAGIFCEFADPDYIVFMLSPEHTEEELARLEQALSAAGSGALVAPAIARGKDAAAARRQEASGDASLRTEPDRPAANRTAERRPCSPCGTVCTLREALLSPCEQLSAGESLGRVLARPGVSCPPAVPIRMPGERIDRAAVEAFRYYGIETVSVLP